MGLLGDLVLRVTPAGTLLTSLAGVGISFLGINQLVGVFALPIVGILPLYLVIAGYFADLRYTFKQLSSY